MLKNIFNLLIIPFLTFISLSSCDDPNIFTITAKYMKISYVDQENNLYKFIEPETQYSIEFDYSKGHIMTKEDISYLYHEIGSKTPDNIIYYGISFESGFPSGYKVIRDKLSFSLYISENDFLEEGYILNSDVIVYYNMY